MFTDRSGWTIEDLACCCGSRDVAKAVGIPFERPARRFEEASDDHLFAQFEALVGDDVEEHDFEEAPESGDPRRRDSTRPTKSGTGGPPSFTSRASRGRGSARRRSRRHRYDRAPLLARVANGEVDYVGLLT